MRFCIIITLWVLMSACTDNKPKTNEDGLVATTPLQKLSPVRITDLATRVRANQTAIQLANEVLELTKTRVSVRAVANSLSGPDHLRLEQTVSGIPVWGGQMVLHRDSGVSSTLIGNFMPATASISSLDMNPTLSAQEATSISKTAVERKSSTNVTYGREEQTLLVFPSDSDAYLAWHVVLFTQPSNESPALWNYFIDAHKGTVLAKFNGLNTLEQASGPGGNPDFTNSWTAELDVEPSGANFEMDTARFQTLDMAGSTVSGTVVTGSNLANLGDAAENDAHGYAEITLNALTVWFNSNSIDNNGFKIISRAHYGNNLENAFWDGSQMTYGDGNTFFHPLSTGLDVVAHEINHGFTEFHSNLIYDGQSGGMNEAFSDIAGTAAEFFHDPANADMLLGEDIIKANVVALRFLCDPALDNLSIGHFQEYYYPLDVHFSSGIMNRAFCLASKRFANAGNPAGNPSQASVMRVSQVFYEANKNYWINSSSFLQGAEGTMDAAVAMGLNAQERQWLGESWADVGLDVRGEEFRLRPLEHTLTLSPNESIALSIIIPRVENFVTPVALTVTGLPTGVTASFSESPTAGGAVTLILTSDATVTSSQNTIEVTGTAGATIRKAFVKVLIAQGVQNGVGLTGLSGARGSLEYFKFTTPDRVRSLSIATSGGNAGNDADLYLRLGSAPELGAADCIDADFDSNESCIRTNMPGGDFVVAVAGFSEYANLNLDVSWVAVELESFQGSVAEVFPGDTLNLDLALNLVLLAGENGDISLTSSEPTGVTLPATVNVGTGETTSQLANVTVADPGVTQEIILTASFNGTSRQISVLVHSLKVSISEFLIPTTDVIGDTTFQATLTITPQAPPGGSTVTLSSNNPAIVMPSSLAFAEGTTQQAFSVRVNAIPDRTIIELTAAVDDSVISSSLTVVGTRDLKGEEAAGVDGLPVALNPLGCISVHRAPTFEGIISYLLSQLLLYLLIAQILFMRVWNKLLCFARKRKQK